MKKKLFVFLIAILVSGLCFAQSSSSLVKALQGTWVLIGGLNDQESFDEAAVKAEKLEVFYIFKGNELTIRKNGEVLGPIRFDASSGFIHVVANGNEAKLAYNLQGKILIIHEGGYAFIYRKR